MVTGWSRRMANLLHKYSVRGERANSEVCLSLALNLQDDLPSTPGGAIAPSWLLCALLANLFVASVKHI